MRFHYNKNLFCFFKKNNNSRTTYTETCFQVFITWTQTTHLVKLFFFKDKAGYAVESHNMFFFAALCRWQTAEVFIWTADQNSVQQQYSAKQQHYQFSSIYVSNFLSSACANTTVELTDEVQHVKPAACLSYSNWHVFFFFYFRDIQYNESQ